MTDPASLLDEISRIDATIKLVGERIILRAGSQPIPANLVCRIRQAKRELSEFIIAHSLYRENDGGDGSETWQSRSPFKRHYSLAQLASCSFTLRRVRLVWKT
jgi:hypothetical protein